MVEKERHYCGQCGRIPSANSPNREQVLAADRGPFMEEQADGTYRCGLMTGGEKYCSFLLVVNTTIRGLGKALGKT